MPKGKRSNGRNHGKTTMDPKKKMILFIVIVVLVIAVSGGVLAFKIWKDHQNQQGQDETSTEPIVVELDEKKEEQAKIFQGNSRPIAFMIDNHQDAQPQAGLNDAYLVYEIIVEGGETRLMTLFKGKDMEKIGPVRSARHYFVDYVMENDAIYVHYGWSPQAQSDIGTYRIQNINGIYESDKTFWRVKDKSAPHNAVTSTEKIQEVAQKKGYRMTSTEKSVLHYVTDEVNLENGQKAEHITIPYSDFKTTTYQYDASNKMYTRLIKGQPQVDWTTKKPIQTKNIIITFAKNYPLNDGENKDRQGLENIGTLKGYYITNGKAIPIQCKKESRNAQTIYQDMNGKEIDVNDGNTFIQICPIDAKVTLEE